MNSDGLTVVRTPLPRELNQAHGERRGMMNPALDIYSTAAPVQPTVCCVSHCGRQAEQGAFCRDCFAQYETYNAWWAAQEASRVRRAACWRFVNGLLFFARVELLVGYCIQSPRIWQTFALGAGCALVVALGNALLGGVKGGAAR